jgi:hypothetical protein
MASGSFAKSRTPSKYLEAIARIARLCERARQRIEMGQYELECHYPYGAEKLSIALSELDKLEEYAVRVIRGLPERERSARGGAG